MENDNRPAQPVRRSKKEITAIVEDWKQSGKSKAQFCLENNFNYQTFFGWIKPKIKKSHSGKKENQSIMSGFAALKIKNPVSESFAEIHFEGGTKIYLHQTVPVNYLKELIR